MIKSIILIATHNKAKLEEIRKGFQLLEKKNVKFYSLDDLKISNEPVESGKTFEINSLIKAKYYAKLSKLPTIADDGGLEIQVLNGEPGTRSKRWLDFDATDKELIHYTLKRLQGFHGKKRKAQLRTCVTFFDPNTKEVLQESEKIDGYIAEKSNGMVTNGFPFRALLIIKKLNKYYGNLSIKEHEEINHRLKALKRLSKKVLAYLIQ